MKLVFADTGYWIAFLDPRDALHLSADRAMKALGDSSVVTTELVLVELLNEFYVRGEHQRNTAAQFVFGLYDDPGVRTV